MKRKQRGQVTPEVMLIAVAAAGIYFGAVYVGKAAKKTGHAIAHVAHVLHHKEPKK